MDERRGGKEWVKRLRRLLEECRGVAVLGAFSLRWVCSMFTGKIARAKSIEWARDLGSFPSGAILLASLFAQINKSVSMRSAVWK